MWIPMMRFGGDERPIRWWEWLFAPVVLPVVCIVLLVGGLALLPLEMLGRFHAYRLEKKFRAGLKAAGRYVRWSDVETKLAAGTGTLIVELCSPLGPIREWWTDDNLGADSPIALPSSAAGEPSDEYLEQLGDYAQSCADRYTHPETGAAALTDVPVPLNYRLDPRKLVVVNIGEHTMPIRLNAGRRLAERYPQGSVVTLVQWTKRPLLFPDDAEAVFMSSTPPQAGETTSGAKA